MEIVDEITMKSRGGYGGTAADESADLKDMKYAEKMILNESFLRALAKLKVVTIEKIDGKEVIKGGMILFDKTELAAEGYSGEINGAAHKFNQEFVALQIAFFAAAYATDKAETKTIEQVDEETGEKSTVTRVLPDKLRVYRISENFDADKYACDASIKVKGTADKKPINNYHEPTTGMRLRVDTWLNQNADKLAKVFAKIGLQVKEVKSE